MGKFNKRKYILLISICYWNIGGKTSEHSCIRKFLVSRKSIQVVNQEPERKNGYTSSYQTSTQEYKNRYLGHNKFHNTQKAFVWILELLLGNLQFAGSIRIYW